MVFKKELLKHLIRVGPSMKNGNRVWDIAHRKFLYMNSELVKKFLALRSYPRYKEIIIHKEIDLLKKLKGSFINQISETNFNLIDLGCGDGTKSKAFFELFKESKSNIRFVPVSVSKELTELTVKNIQNENISRVSKFVPRIACFEEADEIISELRSNDYQKNVILLLGSILASFDINEYLFNLSNAMFPGDVLIIGNGIRKGERLVNLQMYKDSVFKDWTFPLMKELGFNENEVEYDVRFNSVRIEAFYKLKVDKTVDFDGRKIEFKSGDEIMVAKLYKYFPDELEKFCKFYFSNVDILKDSEEEYALVVCKK